MGILGNHVPGDKLLPLPQNPQGHNARIVEETAVPKYRLSLSNVLFITPSPCHPLTLSPSTLSKNIAHPQNSSIIQLCSMTG
ncbi:MAG: hypothetical protein KC449_08805 [Anaerolineales bacterium]|nr:hypothetical protein [Anaerolineales bacterium]